MKNYLILLSASLLLIADGCNRRPSDHGSEQTGSQEKNMATQEAEDTEHENKDYTARCKCLDCDNYITILNQDGTLVARHYFNGRFEEFDVARSERRNVSNSNVDAVTEYLFEDQAGERRILLYVHEGRDRVETVVEAGLEQAGSYTGMKCLGSARYELEDSPNMDLKAFGTIHFYDEGTGLWMQKNDYSNMVSLNYALLKIVSDHRFVEQITLRGRKLHLVPGDRINRETDYTVDFKSDTIPGYNSPTSFSGLPTITTWSEEFGLEQEIRSLHVSDRSGGLDFSLPVYSPMFDAPDTIRLHYSHGNDPGERSM